MAASVEYRLEEMSSGETKEKEKGDDLSLLLDFNGANLNRDHQISNVFKKNLDSESENPLIPETIIHGADDLLNSENKATDYDWLLSPPRNPVPSMEEHKILTSQNLISNGQSTSPESRLEKPQADNISTTKVSSKLPAPSNGVKSTIRRPSPSRKPPSTTRSRPSTPTTRPTIPSTTKPSRSSTPTSRPPLTAATKPIPPPKRSTTPTPRPTKSTSRSSTPTPRPPNNSSVNPTGRSSSATKSRAPVSKNPPPSRGSSPSVKPRPGSAPKGRPGLTETKVKENPKRGSASPLRGPGLNGVKSGVTRSRGCNLKGGDEVNPVLMGTKMVERVVNMRKLAPPKEDYVSNQNTKLSVNQENSGFGRSLSKKSFDMALRHLDIRRSMPGNMRASITKVPASSVYSVRSESTKAQTMSASGDTSSSGSIE